jgi:hypothetical protein
LNALEIDGVRAKFVFTARYGSSAEERQGNSCSHIGQLWVQSCGVGPPAARDADLGRGGRGVWNLVDESVAQPPWHACAGLVCLVVMNLDMLDAGKRQRSIGEEAGRCGRDPTR